MADLIQAAILFGNQGRCGESAASSRGSGVQEQLLRRLDQVIRPSSSFIALDPNRQKRGKDEQTLESSHQR